MHNADADMVTTTCRQCGQAFQRKQRQPFCSVKCRAASQRSPLRTCETCQTPFPPKGEWHGRTRKFCSKVCADKGLIRPDKPCRQCHIPFHAKEQRIKFCSKACSTRWTARHRKNFRGWHRTARGYIAELAPEHPMAMRTGYILQHRRVAAESLGRMLESWEVVDHLNGIKDDNRPENLRVLSKRIHDSLPKPGRKPITCPNCHHVLMLSGRARRVEAVLPPGSSLA